MPRQRAVVRSGVLGLVVLLFCSGCVIFRIGQSGPAGLAATDRAILPILGDFDSDGWAEPVVLTDTGLVMMELCGDGCLRRVDHIPFTVGIHSRAQEAASVADFDADGVDDLAVLQSDGIHVYFGSQGGGSASPGLSLSDSVFVAADYEDPFLGTFPFEGVHAADIDDDGRTDVVLLGAEYHYATIDGQRQVTTPGAFWVPSFGGPCDRRFSRGAADVDGDDQPEFLASTTGACLPDLVYVGWIDVIGVDEFWRHHFTGFGSLGPLGDINSDGYDDITIRFALPQPPPDTADIHLSDGSDFVALTTSNGAPRSVPARTGALHDLDGDGTTDLSTVDVDAQELVWWNGDGNSGFTSPFGIDSFSLDLGPNSDVGPIAYGDVNGDGLTDALVVDRSADLAPATVVLNESFVPTPP
ncbi:MAG: FG-GAP repeat domain-containing protein [Acidimicrobiales bacterium]